LQRSTINATLGIGVLVILAFFVWPTRYRYDRLKTSDFESPVRIDRLTGKTEILYPAGWHVAGGEQGKPAPEPQELPTEEIAKLMGQAEITSIGYVELHLYNGTDWTISEATVLVEVLDAKGNRVISRPYRLRPKYGNSEPQSSTEFEASLGFSLTAGQTWRYSITSAKGIPKKA
jgi:hypothetical protein